MIHAIVADDEPLARARVRRLLGREPDVKIVAECADGRSALDAASRHAVDVIFLDIAMPEVDGLEVARSISRDDGGPIVVFLTAHGRHAVDAFETQALDYLVKPFDPDRFAATIERVRRRLQSIAGGASARVSSSSPSPAPSGSRLAVKTGARTVFVSLDDIDYLEANGNYVVIHAAGATHLVRDTLQAMEQRLDPSRFARIHRRLIVATGRIVSVEPLFAGEYLVTLRSGHKLTSGRTYRARLIQLIEH